MIPPRTGDTSSQAVPARQKNKTMKTSSLIRFPKRPGLILAVLLLSSSLLAQQGTTTPVPTGNDGAGTTPSAAGASPSSSATSLSAQPSLSAAQISAVLQRKPEVVIELKSFVADQAQQKGVPLQADSITDEMLYTQIAASADLRASITLWLLARGYVSQSDLHSSLTNPGSEENDVYGQSSRTPVDSFGQLSSNLASGSSQ